jgi:hypothetical protein
MEDRTMANEAKKVAAPSAQGFAVSVGMLKLFQNDMRVFPREEHPNGYITFDRRMLISILRSKDVEKQMELAKQIEIMRNEGAELVIMKRSV